jgi:exodeoxyribonuclease VII large subunit
MIILWGVQIQAKKQMIPPTDRSAPNAPPVLTVSQLTNTIKHTLEGTFPHIWLQGEISNFKSQTSGHLYFSLKDQQAQIAAVMFRSAAASLRIALKDGAQVVVRGELSVYAPSGRYQIVVRELRLMGAGELLMRLEELKAKLHQRGWFDPQHKKPLPKFPKTIGVVTSPTGAAIQDILNVLSRRFSGFRLLLNPVKVQGEGAAQEIAQAIDQFNRYRLADVLIVGRGGGSIEDLWAFNEEIVAHAIFHSAIPIISAVGHETDVCLSDFVADARAPTPSAAAAMAIADKGHQLHHLHQLHKRLLHTMALLVKRERSRFNTIIRQPPFASPYALLGVWLQRHDDVKLQVDQAVRRSLAAQRLQLDSLKRQLYALRPTTRIQQLRQQLLQWQSQVDNAFIGKKERWKSQLEQLSTQLTNGWYKEQESRRRLFVPATKQKLLESAMTRRLSLCRERYDKLISSIRAIAPTNLLSKGYAILFHEKGDSVITSVAAVAPTDNIRVMLSDGELSATIKGITSR